MGKILPNTLLEGKDPCRNPSKLQGSIVGVIELIKSDLNQDCIYFSDLHSLVSKMLTENKLIIKLDIKVYPRKEYKDLEHISHNCEKVFTSAQPLENLTTHTAAKLCRDHYTSIVHQCASIVHQCASRAPIYSLPQSLPSNLLRFTTWTVIVER